MGWIKYVQLMSPEPYDIPAVPGPAHVAELSPGVPSQQAVAGRERGVLP